MTEEFKPKGEDELRKETVENYGLDPEKDNDLITKIVTDRKKDEDFKASEKEKVKKLREEREADVKKIEELSKASSNDDDNHKREENKDDAESNDGIAKVNDRLDQFELSKITDNEDVQVEIKKYAKANDLSIAEAGKSEFIKFRIAQEEEKAKAEDASADGSKKGQSKTDFSNVNPAKDFDLATEEGRADYEKYKVWLKSQ